MEAVTENSRTWQITYRIILTIVSTRRQIFMRDNLMQDLDEKMKNYAAVSGASSSDRPKDLRPDLFPHTESYLFPDSQRWSNCYTMVKEYLDKIQDMVGGALCKHLEVQENGKILVNKNVEVWQTHRPGGGGVNPITKGIQDELRHE